MAMAGLYRRMLPSPPAIDFASSEGKQLFLEAIQGGTMEGFYRLISYFQTQSEPAYCGLASLSMVLNALAIDPGRKWKGPWRWFDESMLDCCEPLEKVKEKGISFGKLVCLAHCAGAKVEAFRTNQSTIDDFRKYITQCSASEDCHVISSYYRGAFKQTGTGHFSPIGGYHAGRDMALILDVARFKYPPHWVPLTLLWEAMDRVDDATGQRRGFVLVSRPHREPGLLYTLSCKHENWVGIAKYLVDEVPKIVKSKDFKDFEEVLTILFTSLPSNFGEFVKWVAEVRRREDGDHSLSQEEKGRLALKEEVLRQVQETLLFKHVVTFLSSVNSCCRSMSVLVHKNELPDIAEKVCCQGARILAGKFDSSERFYCRETCVKCLKANSDKPVTLVSGTVVNGSIEQEVDVLVPSSQIGGCGCGPSNYIGIYPVGNDILTVLILALPKETWSGIRDEKLSRQILGLVTTENLPTLLQEEVLHLRRQLHILRRCQENKVVPSCRSKCCLPRVQMTWSMTESYFPEIKT
ncbi:glutathione gamma-glutamylcysteinyltransferase 1 [Citrus sinensis]|uniref:glutathione gamma-glutamylcysteinyltransferase 1-like isoform X1 n=1 Tax=Citrus sinensis TaxID=2711 RepID=UPI00218F8AB5|nr:glutathione gamma-glutamylcysteinyltransferase 1-like isoform X1 [Citrus sinensis]KAH9729236.1 glutathione gamma-glutamylcysteinyltransferase 1 [Citrus sinensis]